MTAPDVNADVRARFEAGARRKGLDVTRWNERKRGALPNEYMKLDTDMAWAGYLMAHADLAGEVRELVEAASQGVIDGTGRLYFESGHKADNFRRALAALAAQGQGEPVADLEPFREAIVFACTNGNMDKWRRVLASFDSFAYRYKRNTHPAPAASPAGVPDGWAEAYAAFKGAFDTPAAWRRDDSEYANDARKRLRELNDSFLAAPSAPEGDGGAAHG